MCLGQLVEDLLEIVDQFLLLLLLVAEDAGHVLVEVGNHKGMHFGQSRPFD